MNIFTLFLCVVFGFISQMKAQSLEPFRLYSKEGKEISYKKMVDDCAKQDVVLFGEFHNNSIVHWLQLQVMKNLSQKRSLIFGLEMFERDQQMILNLLLNNEIDQKRFDTITRFWNNYKTDYHPMVSYAKDKKIPLIASNVPRKYASLLYKQGEEALVKLSDKEKQWMAPLPFPYDASLPAYQEMLKMFYDPTHANPNFPKAQAIKDATMAYSITENWQQGQLFYHINGSYHSNNYEGIYWYLKKYNSNLKVVTISVVEVDEVSKFNKEDKNLADYIFYIPTDMTKTY